MEVSLVRSSQVKTGRCELGHRELGFCKFNGNLKTKISFGQSSSWENGRLRFTLRAVQSESVRPVKAPGPSKRSKSNDEVSTVRLFVGLPLDAVSDCHSVKHTRAIAAGLKALKLLGVTGVELPIWWGIVENEAMGKYEWSAYHSLIEMVQKAGLELHVSLCFHASKKPNVSLPDWVSQIGVSQPGVFFKDRSRQQYKECLSLAVDELPVLNGKTPIQVYSDFCESFKAAFSSFLGSTITGVSVSLGPDGELRYPSHHQAVKSDKIPGVGEFQCFDENMLSILKQHAEATGNPLWGLGGPHDAPSYDQAPHSNAFFKDHGSWESPYGDFFLSWYSNQLIYHGNRMLSLASSTFTDTGVTVYGRVPLMHSWYNTRSHPSELTSGFYNTSSRDGYEAVADMFARNSCKMILPGLDLSDEHQPQGSLSSPESLLSQIKSVCRKHGVEVSGQNSSLSAAPGGFQQIKKNLLGENAIDLFTYQRMGAYFFSPEHFPSFAGFVRSLDQLELQSDDLPTEEEATESIHNVNSEAGIHMQTA